MDEQVLVIPTATLGEQAAFLGFRPIDATTLTSLWNLPGWNFLPRSRAETDPSHKQIVPYLVLRAGDRLFWYQRGSKGTETRLHRLGSIGIGGHVVAEDGPAGQGAYEAGRDRELAEEVAPNCRYREQVIGLVHDDRTPVGAVHLGVVHLLDLESDSVTPIDPALADARFRPLSELVRERDQLESWSAFVLDHLAERA